MVTEKKEIIKKTSEDLNMDYELVESICNHYYDKISERMLKLDRIKTMRDLLIRIEGIGTLFMRKKLIAEYEDKALSNVVKNGNKNVNFKIQIKIHSQRNKWQTYNKVLKMVTKLHDARNKFKKDKLEKPDFKSVV